MHNFKKRNLFVDVDGVILDSITIICKIYNSKYSNHKDFKIAYPNKVTCWDFKQQCPLAREQNNSNSKIITEWFGSDLFWKLADELKPIKNSITSLKILSQKYNIIFCSIGSPNNISKKALWLNKYFPQYNQILIKNHDCTMNKSCVNMENSIFIDDSMKNLESSNAKYKFIFGKLYDWNRGWTKDIHNEQDGYFYDWSEATPILMNI